MQRKHLEPGLYYVRYRGKNVVGRYNGQKWIVLGMEYADFTDWDALDDVLGEIPQLGLEGQSERGWLRKRVQYLEAQLSIAAFRSGCCCASPPADVKVEFDTATPPTPQQHDAADEDLERASRGVECAIAALGKFIAANPSRPAAAQANKVIRDLLRSLELIGPSE